jgi:malonyl CoA-acyl carrier protein transacylase
MSTGRPVVLLVAAHSRAALLDALRRWRAMTVAELAAAGEPSSTGRERLALVASEEAVHAGLDFALARLPTMTAPRWTARAHGVSYARDTSPGKVAFLFPGQGSQSFGMLGELRRRAAVVRVWFDALDAAAVAGGMPPFTQLLDGSGSDAESAERRAALHDMERGAQLGTVADLALCDVLATLGIAADLHIGHSNGEHPAVIAAGRVAASREELCAGFVRLGAAGARLPKPRRREGILAVSALSRETLERLLQADPSGLSLAMDNCPTQLAVGGVTAALATLARKVAEAGGVAVQLPFDRAFHTPLFADWAHTLRDYYRQLPLQAGRLAVYSCHTNAPLPADSDGCRDAMAAQWTRLICFRATIERVYEEGVRTFVEVGPGSTLTAFVEDALRGRPHLAISTSSTTRSEVEQLCHLLAGLFVAGVTVDPARLGALLGTPTPWGDAVSVHRRLIDDARAMLERAAGARLEPPRSALLANPVRDAVGGLRMRRRFSRATDPFVDHHALGRSSAAHPDGGYPLPVLPFTVSLELAAEAARALTGRPARELRAARAFRWLTLDHGTLTIEVGATPLINGVAVRLSEADGHAPGPAFEATVSSNTLAPPPAVAPDPLARAPRFWTVSRFYASYAFHGPAFQGLAEVLSVGPSSVEATVTITEIATLPPDALELDPAMLDCVGQLVAFWLLDHGRREPSFGIFPFAVDRVVLCCPPLPRGTLLRCRCSVVLAGSITEAKCVFETLDGRLVAALEGFRQRLVPLPEALARTIFSGRPAACGLLSANIDPDFFTSSWGIWERALAHLILSPSDLAHWQAVPTAGARLRWLLERWGAMSEE